MGDNDMQDIGLEAVLKDENFQAGVKRYDTATDQMVKKTEHTSSVLNSFGRVIETGVGTAMGFLTAQAIPKIVDGLGDFIKSAAEAEKIEKGLDAVLLATGGAAGVTKEAALDLANGFAQLTTFEDDSIVAAESVLLRFKSINKETFPQATELTLDLAQALGMDLSSAAKLLGKALEDPASGIGKLRIAGVNLTDEQEKLVKSMAEAGNTAGAQKLIMDELAKSVGGAAKLAGQTAEGQWKIFQNQLGNLGESIGAAFLPILTDLTKTINKDILPAFQEWISDAMPQIQSALQNFGTLITENWPTIQAAISTAWSVIEPILKSLANLFDVLFTNLRVNFEVGGVSAGIEGFAAGLLENFGMSEEQIADLITAFDNFAESIQKMWATIQPILDAVFSELAKFWKEIQPKLEAAWSAIVIKVQDTWNFIWNDVLKPIIGAIVDFIREHHDEIQRIITGVMQYLKGFIDVTWSAIKGIIKIALDLISGNFEGAAADWDEMMRGVMSGLQTMFSGAWDAIKGIFSLALAALVTAITTKASEIASEMGKAISGAVAAIQAQYQSFVDAGAALISKIVSGVQNAPNTIASAVAAAVSAAASLPGNVWDGITGIGRAIVDHIVAGIKDPLSSIANAIANLIKDAIAAATSFLTGGKSSKDVIPMSGFDLSASSRLALAQSSAGAAIYGTTTVNNYFNLTTNSLASAASLASDFGIMRSLAGV